MASYETAAAATTINPPPSISHDIELNIPFRKKLYSFILSSPFTVFSDSSKSAAFRVINGNLERFSLCYMIFIAIALFIALVHKLPMMYLIDTSYIIFLYYILLHLMPDIIAFYKLIGTRSRLLFVLIVLFLVGSITILGLFLTEGETFVFVALAAMMPIVGLYAALSKGDDEIVEERFGVHVASCPENLV